MENIESLLNQQQENLAALRQILSQEKQAIVARNALNIEHFAKQKLERIQKAQLLDHQIAKHPQRASLVDSPLLAQQVIELTSLVSQCQQQNDINGEALQRAQLSFHKLNNLFQQSRGKQQMTYNSDGIAQNICSLGTNLKA
ncbi:TPA: flagella synthesis protein FlgN [Photobacterium damselae]